MKDKVFALRSGYGDQAAALEEENSGSLDTHEDLIEKIAAQRDKEAFISLFEYYAPRIKSFLIKGGLNQTQADELAQEAMLSVWQKADTYKRCHAGASTWIFTIARNKKIDLFRKKKRIEVDIDDVTLVNDDLPANENIDREREAEVIGEAIKTLPDAQAELIYKSFFEEKTHADIAKETKLPLGTVKSRIRLALERLRKNMKVREIWT